jgi:hypothetical protein
MVGTASEISTRRNSRSMAAHFDPIGIKAPDRGLLERADCCPKNRSQHGEEACRPCCGASGSFGRKRSRPKLSS